jgi:hypothetical protein
VLVHYLNEFNVPVDRRFPLPASGRTQYDAPGRYVLKERLFHYKLRSSHFGRGRTDRCSQGMCARPRYHNQQVPMDTEEQV